MDKQLSEEKNKHYLIKHMYAYHVPGTVLSRYIAVKETDNNFCPCGAYILVNLKSLDFTNQI